MKHFSRCLERICQLDCVAIPGQKRDMWISYKRNYSRDNNAWGDFQVHRKALGLISVGRCTNDSEFEELFESYKKEKEQYSDTLYNSKLVVFGMNTDGTEITAEQQQSFDEDASSPPITFKIDTSSNDTNEKTEFTTCDSNDALTSPDDNSIDSQVFGNVPIDPLRKPVEEIQTILEETENLSDSPKKSFEESSSQITFIRHKTDKIENKNLKSVKQAALSRNSSNNSVKDLPGSEVVYYPSIDRCDGLEENVRDFVTSLFFVLEGNAPSQVFFRYVFFILPVYSVHIPVSHW